MTPAEQHTVPINAPRLDQYLAGLIANARDAIFATDESGCVVTWNTAAERLFGLSARAALGRSVDFLDLPGVPADADKQMGNVLRRVVASEEPEHARVTCLCASGERVKDAA